MNKIFKLAISVLCLLWSINSVFAQEEKPWWISNSAELLRLSKDRNFEYVYGFGEGNTRTEARLMAEADSYRQATARIKGVTFSETTYKEIERNGLVATLGEYGTHYTMVCPFVPDHPDPVTGEYNAYILYAWQKDFRIEPRFYEVDSSICNSRMTPIYPPSFRAIIPGMAQIYKGSKTKGGIIIAGQIISLGGIVASYTLPSYYNGKFNQTNDPNRKQHYAHCAKLWSGPLRTASWTFAGIIYAYNLFDGLFAPGKLHYVAGNTDLSLSPYVTSFGNGMTLSLTF